MRYELRDRNGFGQMMTFGAAGKISDSLSALGRLQWSKAKFMERGNTSMNAEAALAVRPLESDRVALLFSYARRSFAQEAEEGKAATTDLSDTISTDGLWQATKSLELYGRFALKYGANGDQRLAHTSVLTYMAQTRAEQRLNRYLDVAGELRWLKQPSTRTSRASVGAELGFWVLPDLRLGAGYNMTSAKEPGGVALSNAPRPQSGFYFTISSKLSNIFNLFGTAKRGLASSLASEAFESQPNGGGTQR